MRELHSGEPSNCAKHLLELRRSLLPGDYLHNGGPGLALLNPLCNSVSMCSLTTRFLTDSTKGPKKTKRGRGE